MPLRYLHLLLAFAFLAGCAAEVKRHLVELTVTTPERGQRYETAQAVEVMPGNGYPRTIAAATEFIAVGRVPYGLVLRPVHSVLTVEGAHMHEAYAVVHDSQLVGFYLPVERAYAPLVQPASLPLVQRKQ
jgi:hypothetical protein